MTSCIDYCDKACQHRRLMATMLCQQLFVPLYFRASGLYGTRNRQHAAAIFAAVTQRKSLLRSGTARIHPS